MQASGKNYVIFFAYSNIDVSLVLLLGVYLLLKISNWQLKCCPAIALLWLTKLLPCLISNSANYRWWLSISPLAPCQQAYQGRAGCQPASLVKTGRCSRECPHVSWQTWGSHAMSHPVAWQGTGWRFSERSGVTWRGTCATPAPLTCGHCYWR